jgi:hypothetical protein
MTNFDTDGGTTREDLVQRVALMEAMIAEGRQTTARFGWVFLMWGLVYFAAVGWSFLLPFANLAWPVCVTTAIVILGVAKARRRRAGERENLRLRSIESVWKGMGCAIGLYIISAVVSHHMNGPAFWAAILFFVGLAHGISAMILRWGMQGVAAAIWCGGGIATFFFTRQSEGIGIFLTATFFGQILFGLYVMMLDRRRAAAMVQHHA